MTLFCGIDEAGRGPLAGPVCAAAVILPELFPFDILNDSKKLLPVTREKLKNIICREALAWGIGWASAAEIDEINIHAASLLAMKRAFQVIEQDWLQDNPQGLHNCRAIADGRFVPELPVSCEALVKADSLVPAVMAASILAKCARDRLMEHYSIFYPLYGYEKHKGYPTKAHREAIKRYGPSPIQRMTYKMSYR